MVEVIGGKGSIRVMELAEGHDCSGLRRYRLDIDAFDENTRKAL